MDIKLTEEQKERMRANRERALAIQRERKRKLEEKTNAGGSMVDGRGNLEHDDDKKKGNDGKKMKGGDDDDDEREDNLVLEDFEVDATPLVNKSEAMKTYCLPEGTLSVCECVEKDNPRHRSWKPMKLYRRSEIRRRARDRFGGLEGLVKERERRKEKQFKKDMERSRDIFKS
mmetsp:Transcript_2294/g.3322  ORF Transcript_2294/g.3322 Transcript_2294/m.3322 type:complete len:173 (-) Transcript_2294:99-617(-)|eukprot:CAMPEP_0118701880 /NCGR_PEP_ID=MMETSP0800-20121206/17529_1 /TAXON_ID=210618 ORGANISM="Striatella unipunctata, Strain CCMP2910" /NCGR_SAMPLE_ID=MMETSP0800 /ASSEMBLY_ACC=CAM_ASM_000638 /LENGTH=172 /DNA_ID=CAMNT_0006602915 /DNA_START=291 /DNA_END=809 /DNA_ORIENTATION=+